MSSTRAAAIAELTASGQPHEITTIELNGRSTKVFANAPDSLRQLFAENVSEQDFIVYEDERYSFQEAYDLSCRLATQLQDRFGVQHGDRVAISMRNYPEWIIAFMATTSIGGIAVAMNAWWEPEEIEQGLEDCGAKVIFADQERMDRIAKISAPNTAVVAVRPQSDDFQGVAYTELMAEQPQVAMPDVQVAPEDAATIFYTSGSTGFPKGALASNRNILSALFSWELDGLTALKVAGLEPPELPYQNATLLAVPLFHATGSHAVYLASYRAQRKIVSMYKWQADDAAALIEQEKISSFVAPAAMTGDLVQAARTTNRDLSSLTNVGGGGAPRAPEQVRDIDDAFEAALPGTGWGMTETNAIGTGIGGQDYLDRPASSGRASQILELKVVDESGDELPQGERGELWIRGASVINGYWRRPEANQETFTDGWLHTGDVAYFDEDGFVFIVDRIKDLIIRGGENIGCGEVEAALLEHPEVLEASVYAVPDERLGEEVGATVYSENGLQEESLRAFLDQRLAKFKIPRYLHIIASPLPRIASGKIYKKQIREDAINSIGAV